MNQARRIRNPAALSYWRRRRNLEGRIDEIRYWQLRCPSCGHVGGIETSLRKLRAASLICSACGAYLWRNNNPEHA